MVSRSRTEAKTWVYKFESTPYDALNVLSTFGFGGNNPKGEISILSEDGWQPFYSGKNNEEVRSFRFTFEGTDGQIRKMLRSAVWAVRRDEDGEQEWEHALIASFGQQMKEQGFPRSSA